MSGNDVQDIKGLIGIAARGDSLSESQAEQAFSIIMSGNATPAQTGGLLMALRVRGETVAELTGAARVMRRKRLPASAPPDAIDIVGTGGDGAGTWNISTAAAIVVGACGVPVAKHGNRAVSSRSGASDVLSQLGVNVETDLANVERAIRDAGIGFLLAPRHHSAMRHVMPARVELGTRTIFNLLGPLTNPAGVSRIMVGVFARDWVGPLAEVLGRLGIERAWVVHGSDGLDEMTTTGPSAVAEWSDGRLRRFEVDPEAVGLPLADPATLKGGDPQTNATALRALLDGQRGAYRDIVLLNAAAALTVAGRVDGLEAGIAMAATAIDGGGARRTLNRLIEICA